MATLSPAYLERKIVKTDFHHVPDTTVTVCTLVLDTGFAVVGYDGCLDPRDYTKQLGEKYAQEAAMRKLWELEAYAEKQRRYDLTKLES